MTISNFQVVDDQQKKMLKSITKVSDMNTLVDSL